MRRYKTCEFGHTMAPFDALGFTGYGHIHEDEAFTCAMYQRKGWPDPSEVVWNAEA